MDDDKPLASLSVTHVHYDPTDPISHISAYLALLPQALMVAYATLVLTTREIEIGLMLAGQLVCEAANFALKRFIREERPTRMHGKGYGMPSSHAQFVAFWSVYLALFVLVRHKSKDAGWEQLAERGFMVLGALVGAVAVAASRIYLGYHTTRQVMVGVGMGMFCAVVWFAVTAWARRSGWIEWALEIKVARVFRIRDLLLDEDLPHAGWVRWQEKRRVRRRGGFKKS